MTEAEHPAQNMNKKDCSTDGEEPDGQVWSSVQCLERSGAFSTRLPLLDLAFAPVSSEKSEGHRSSPLTDDQ